MISHAVNDLARKVFQINVIYLNHIRPRENENIMQFTVTNKIIAGELYAQ